MPNPLALSCKCANCSSVSLRVPSILLSKPNLLAILICSEAPSPCIDFLRSCITKSADFTFPSLSFTEIPSAVKTSLPSPLSNFANSPTLSANPRMDSCNPSALPPLILATYSHCCKDSIPTPKSFDNLLVCVMASVVELTQEFKAIPAPPKATLESPIALIEVLSPAFNLSRGSKLPINDILLTNSLTTI